jgi:hypothetical protein
MPTFIARAVSACQHGRSIGGLTIVNPFIKSAP